MPGNNLSRKPIPESLGAEILETCRRVAREVEAAGGAAWMVGGAVRDALLGRSAGDADLEIFGLPADQLESLLRRDFEVESVGKSFGVFKLKRVALDVSLPRKERKTGLGHRGFQVDSDPLLSRKQAALRRDFTINAIFWNPLTDELDDPLNGRKDLEDRILRHCGPQFAEDPLRVLRATQLIARFGLEPDPATRELCQTIQSEGLPPERLWEEWKKLILLGMHIQSGLRFLESVGWLANYPELQAMAKCPQDPVWHPEGDVWTHTLHALDAFSRERIGDPWEDLVVGLAVLCHDIGKPATTTHESGRIRSKGHPEAGEGPTRRFLARLTRQTRLIEDVVSLVIHHHRPMELWQAKAGDAAVRRLARRVGRLDRLVRVTSADRQGRPPLPGKPSPEGEWLSERSRALGVEDSTPQPILKGRHLLELGLAPGPHFGWILARCFDAQLEGTFENEDQGREFLRQNLQSLRRKPPGQAKD